MGTLSSCLKKNGLSAHEQAILKGAADDNVKDGDAAHIAAVRAVADFIERVEKERSAVSAQIVAKGGKATDAPFKLADIASLTSVLRKEDATIPEGWTQGETMDGRASYTYQPNGIDGGAWSSIDHILGSAYRVRMYSGRELGPVEEESGSLSTILGNAKKTVDALNASGIHIEEGQIERVTPSVIAASVKESAKNTAFNPKQALDWLVSEVTKAIKAAPTALEAGAWDKVNKKVSTQNIMNVDEAIGFKVFDVPGDGKFKVLNVKEKLQAFLKNVESNPGFKKPKADAKPQLVPDWQKTGGSGSEAMVREFLEDGDYITAFDYAKQIGKPLVFGFNNQDNTEPNVYSDVREFTHEGFDDFKFVVGKHYDGKAKNHTWAVIELSSGLAVKSGLPTKAKAETAAHVALDSEKDGKKVVTPDSLRAMIADKLVNKEGAGQEELSEKWLAWAESKESNNSLLKDEKKEAAKPEIQRDDEKRDKEYRKNWYSAGVGTGGVIHYKREFEFEGKPVEAVMWETAGRYNDGYVMYDGKKTTFRDSNSVQDQIDRFLDARFLSQKPLDSKGFERFNVNSNGAFELRDGNMIVRVEPTENGKYQASFRGAKSSPHLQGVQGAIDWADAYRQESIRAEKEGAAKADEEWKQPTKEWPFIDNSGNFWSADGKSKLPDTWTGLIQGAHGNFMYVGQDNGERAWFPLKSEKYDDAVKESEPLDRVGGNLESYIKIAADSIKQLRKVDVDRVLSQSHIPKKLVADFIIGHRDDLKDEVKAVMAEQDVSTDTTSAKDYGSPVASFKTVKEFDAWLKPLAKKQPEQFNGGDEGVGYFVVSGEDKGYKSVAGISGAGVRQVRNDQRDTRLVYRLDDGRLVWWDFETKNVFEAKESDPRVVITIEAKNDEDNQDHWYEVTVDGETHSLSLNKPIDQVDLDDLKDELYMRGYEGAVADAFYKLRKDSTVDAVIEAKPDPLNQTFEQWLDAMYESNPYKDRYLENNNGDVQATKYETALGNSDTEEGARYAYSRALLAMPRDADLSLEVFDSLTPEMQREASRHFFGIDSKWSEREQERGRQAYKEEQAAVAPVQEELDKVNTELKKRDHKPMTAVEQNLIKKQAKLENEIADIKSGKNRSADAGEELTYNKRNRRKGGLSWEDISEKNTTLQAKEVVKAKVYPKPDYEGMVAGGMKPVIAHMVKQIYDSIAAKPKLGRGEVLGEAAYKAYINGVNRVMGEVMRWANDPVAHASWAMRQTKLAGGSFSVMDTFSKNDTPKDFVYPNSWKAFDREVYYLGGNKFLGGLQPGYEEVGRAIKDIKMGWPAGVESWKKQGYKIIEATNLKAEFYPREPKNGEPFVTAYISKDDGSGRSTTVTTVTVKGTSNVDDQFVQESVNGTVADLNNKFVLQDKVGRMIGAFDSQEEAEEGARAATKKEKDSGDVKEIGRHVTEVQRVGTERRMEGQDVSSEDVKNTFGFRGVNFGNSMQGDSKALTKERQLHLNHIYDAFMDLAELLNVPPQALSLNGMLGIAVGAQGSGKALAHFVPGVNEINITRRAGAGALAHEWGHALDHYFGTMADLATKERPYLTEFVGGPRKETVQVDGKWVTREVTLPNVRPEVVAQFTSIVNAMKKRPETMEERKKRLEDGIETSKKNLKQWLDYFKKEAVKTSGEKSIADFDAMGERLANLDLGDGKVAIGKGVEVSPTVAELKELFERDAGIKIDKDYLINVQYYADRTKLLSDMLKADEVNEPAIVDTDYFKASKSADGSKQKQYWSSTLEMFARALDAYVVDSLADKESKNQYLGGIEAVAPSGAERLAINRAFDFLFAELKTKETERGIAIFNATDADPLPESEWLTDAEITESILPVLEVYGKTRIPVRIFNNLSEAAAQGAAVGGVVSASGLVHKGQIFLIRDGLDSRDAVVRTMFHELFHYGLRRFMTRPQYIEAMQDLYDVSDIVKQFADDFVKSSQGDGLRSRGESDEYIRARGVDEALAAIAEEFSKAQIDRKIITKPSEEMSLIEKLAQWLSSVARKFGFDRLADSLKVEKEVVEYRNTKVLDNTNPYVVEFVRSILSRMESGEAAAKGAMLPYSDAAFSARKRFDVIDSVAIDSSEVDADKSNPHEYRLAVEEIAKDRYSGKPASPVTVNSTNEVVFVSWSSARHVLRDGKPSWKTALAVLHMEPLIASAERVGYKQDYKGRADPIGAEFYRTYATIDGEKHEVSITVRVHSDGRRYYDHLVVEPVSAGLHERQETDTGNSPTHPFTETGDEILDQESSDSNQYSKGGKSTNVSPSDIRSALTERFGAEGIANLESAGTLKVMRLKDAPANVRKAAEAENASALYVNGVAYLFSDRMTAEQAPGKLLHEIGEHYGLERMLGKAGYAALMKRVSTMAKVRGSVAYGAWQGVKANYGEFKNMNESELAGNERFMHEVLAAIGENQQGQATSLWRELLAKLKAWLADKGILADWMNEGDIANLVSGSLKKVMRDAGVVAAPTMDSFLTEQFNWITDAMKADKHIIKECA